LEALIFKAFSDFQALMFPMFPIPPTLLPFYDDEIKEIDI